MNEKHLKLFTPVSERLPEVAGYYLCICNNGIEEWSSIERWIMKEDILKTLTEKGVVL